MGGFNISESGSAHMRAIFNAALESQDGITIRSLRKTKAIQMRAYLHAIRASDRKKMKAMYPDPADPNHGRSAYDVLFTEIVPGGPCDIDEGEGIVHLRITKGQTLVSDLLIEDNATHLPINIDDYKS